MGQKPSDLLVLYCKMMEEIKERLDVLKGIYSSQFKLPTMAAYELCWLELRMICELIALGCLAAHGDIPMSNSKKLQRAWNPEQILAALESLHPQFYPIPCDQEVEKGILKSAILLDDEKTIYLRKDELLKLYGLCGDHLHRGNIKSIKRNVGAADFVKLAEWQRKIVRLLNRHYIPMHDNKNGMYVVMRDAITKKATVLSISRVEASPGWDERYGKP